MGGGIAVRPGTGAPLGRHLTRLTQECALCPRLHPSWAKNVFPSFKIMLLEHVTYSSSSALYPRAACRPPARARSACSLRDGSPLVGGGSPVRPQHRRAADSRPAARAAQRAYAAWRRLACRLRWPHAVVAAGAASDRLPRQPAQGTRSSGGGSTVASSGRFQAGCQNSSQNW